MNEPIQWTLVSCWAARIMEWPICCSFFIIFCICPSASQSRANPLDLCQLFDITLFLFKVLLDYCRIFWGHYNKLRFRFRFGFEFWLNISFIVQVWWKSPFEFWTSSGKSEKKKGAQFLDQIGPGLKFTFKQDQQALVKQKINKEEKNLFKLYGCD